MGKLTAPDPDMVVEVGFSASLLANGVFVANWDTTQFFVYDDETWQDSTMYASPQEGLRRLAGHLEGMTPKTPDDPDADPSSAISIVRCWRALHGDQWLAGVIAAATSEEVNHGV
jgi:hypothetical protein